MEIFKNTGIKIDSIVVSLAYRGPRKPGDIFKVLPKSHSNDLYYTEVNSSFRNEEWRLATENEIIHYNNGIKNIYDILQEPIYEIY